MLTSILLGIFVLPVLLLIIIPLIDNIFSADFLYYFNSSFSSLNESLGTNATNYILILLGLILFLIFYKFILRALSVFGASNNHR